VTVNEDLIRRALLRSTSADLDAVLTTVEAYRACVQTAHRLRPAPGMQERRDQVLECAGSCREALERFAKTGKLRQLRNPSSGEARFTFRYRW
jgi:hypothetical protein